MTALIGRWHSNAPLRSAREAAYADRLEVEKLELALKLSQANKDLRTLNKKVHQEQELQLTTESLVVEARGLLQRCHGTSLQLAALLTCLYRTVLHANYYPSDHRVHYAAPLCNSTTKKCWENTSIELPQSHALRRPGVRSQIKACENGNVISWDTASKLGEKTATCVSSVVRSSAINAERSGYSDIPETAAAASVASQNGGTQIDACLLRCCDDVDACVEELGKRCSTNARWSEIVSPSLDAMFLADGSSASTCKFWNENETFCSELSPKSTITASSVSLMSDSNVLEKANGTKLIDSKTDTLSRHEAFYFNNVDNVSSLNLDEETVSASNQSEAQKSGYINYSNTPCMPTNRVELDADCLISDMSRLDLNSISLPSDYMTRPPRLCLPKLGGPLKECLEMVQTLVTLSDPNVPRERAPETGPVRCATGNGGSVANNDDVTAAIGDCVIPVNNDCGTPAPNNYGTAATKDNITTVTDDRAVAQSKGPVPSTHDNHILVSRDVSSDAGGDVVCSREFTGAVDDERPGINCSKTNISMLTHHVSTQPNSNISSSDENFCSNLTDTEKLKPLIITGESKGTPKNGVQRRGLLVDISTSTNHENLDGVSDQVYIINNRAGHVDSGFGTHLREEKKGPIQKSKKDRNRNSIIRPSRNNKRNCELVSTPDIT